MVRDFWCTPAWLEVQKLQKNNRIMGKANMPGKPITRTNSFESMKVFIVTTIFSTIMGTYV